MKSKLTTLLLLLTGTQWSIAQDLLSVLEDSSVKKEYVTGAFKSPRVIMTHSVEMLPPGVLDFRILHRFGNVNQGIGAFFGLDDATIRLGLDYGLSKNLTVGIGRSSYKKELDGFLKFRVLQQAAGPGALPFSLVLAGGATIQTAAWVGMEKDKSFTNRQAFYGQLIAGRKFSPSFTLQLAPTLVHRNLVAAVDENNTYALGTGARLKISRRVSLNMDSYFVFNKSRAVKTYNPLSLGVDIETGGHVFQLHFTNAIGMNERTFLTETTNSWRRGDIQFGFNISRVFQVKKKKIG